MPEGQNDENKEQNHRICKKRDGADCGDGVGSIVGGNDPAGQIIYRIY